MDNHDKLIIFTLSIIHGPRGDLRFAAQHPRTLSSAVVDLLDDNDTEPWAMKLGTKTQAQRQPLSNRSNDDDTKPPVKRQWNMFGFWATMQPESKKPKKSKKPKTSGTQLTLGFGQTSKDVSKKAVLTKVDE